MQTSSLFANCFGCACMLLAQPYVNHYHNAFNVYRRELAPGTVSLTSDRAQGDDSKHWAYSMFESVLVVSLC